MFLEIRNLQLLTHFADTYVDFFCFDPGPTAKDDFSTFSDGFLKM